MEKSTMRLSTRKPRPIAQSELAADNRLPADAASRPEYGDGRAPGGRSRTLSHPPKTDARSLPWSWPPLP